MKGVPESFEVEDELYYLTPSPTRRRLASPSIDVLAEMSPSVRYKQPHPAVWITSHPNSPHRRHHPGTRRTHARPDAVQNAAGECGDLGGEEAECSPSG